MLDENKMENFISATEKAGKQVNNLLTFAVD